MNLFVAVATAGLVEAEMAAAIRALVSRLPALSGLDAHKDDSAAM
jgi:hypothetical protein